MRVLFFIFIAFTFSVTAQTTALKKSFVDGTNAARSGDFEQASKAFQSVLLTAENGNAPDEFLARVHYNLGVCFYRLKMPKEAVSELNRAINLSSGNYPKAFYALGMAQADLQNWDAAETAFLAVLTTDISNGETWFDLALIYLQKQNYEKAEAAFRNSIVYNSVATPDAHNNLGVIFAIKSDWRNAEKEFNIALESSGGKSVEAENNLRFCKYYNQSFDKNLTAKLMLSQAKHLGD